MVCVMDDTVVLPWLSSEESDITVEVVDSGEDDVGLFSVLLESVGVDGDNKVVVLGVDNASCSTIWELSSSHLFRLTGVDDLDDDCSLRSLLVRLLLRSALGAADEEDEAAVDLLPELLFSFLLLFVEDPGLVVRVIRSFFFLFFFFF